MSQSRDYYTARGTTDLALFQYHLRVTCQKCGHATVFSGSSLWWLCERRQWPDAINHVVGRLYCVKCFDSSQGRVKRPRWEVTRDPVTANALAEPTAQQWKALVKRNRT